MAETLNPDHQINHSIQQRGAQSLFLWDSAPTPCGLGALGSRPRGHGVCNLPPGPCCPPSPLAPLRQPVLNASLPFGPLELLAAPLPPPPGMALPGVCPLRLTRPLQTSDPTSWGSLRPTPTLPYWDKASKAAVSWPRGPSPAPLVPSQGSAQELAGAPRGEAQPSRTPGSLQGARGWPAGACLLPAQGAPLSGPHAASVKA